MIFVDTGAWFSAFVPNDADHVMADAWLETNTDLLVTTDYVIDELLTLMKIRGEFQRALRLGADLFAERLPTSSGSSPTISSRPGTPSDAITIRAGVLRTVSAGWSCNGSGSSRPSRLMPISANLGR